MIYFIIIFIIILVVLGISYYAFRIAFLAPEHLEPNKYIVPEGPQYDELREDIRKSVNKMAARPYESVTITSFDGTKLFARYYHAADHAPIQIQFHGYKSCSLLDLSGGSFLAEKLGHNALIVDQRSHGQSEGNVITFGIKERRDCLCWINYALDRFGKDVPVILSGLSMGAATVLMVTDLDLPKNVRGIIADCPYSSPREIILKVGKEMHFPPTLMYPFVYLGALLFGRFNLTESDAVSAVRNTDIPILLLHGEDDRFVPCEMSHQIKKAGGDHITLVTFPDAGHGLCYMVIPELYEKATREFVDKIMG